MLDMEDVRQDLSEHFGVVGDRIVGSFRSQPSYLRYSEADFLITPAQPEPTSVVAVSRVKDRNYGTYTSRSSDVKQKPAAIGKDKKYRIANIEDKEGPQSSDPGTSSGRNATVSSNMTQSSISTTSSFGINVRGLEEDVINYRNPDV